MLTLREAVERHPLVREYLAAAAAFDAAATNMRGSYLGLVPDIGREVLKYRPRDPRRRVADLLSGIAADVAAREEFVAWYAPRRFEELSAIRERYPELPETIHNGTVSGILMAKFHEGFVSFYGKTMVTYNERREVVLRGKLKYFGCGVFCGTEGYELLDSRLTVVHREHRYGIEALPCGLLTDSDEDDRRITALGIGGIVPAPRICDDFGEAITVDTFATWIDTLWMQVIG